MKVAIAIIDLFDLGSGKCRESSIGNRQDIREKNQEKESERKGIHLDPAINLMRPSFWDSASKSVIRKLDISIMNKRYVYRVPCCSDQGHPEPIKPELKAPRIGRRSLVVQSSRARKSDPSSRNGFARGQPGAEQGWARQFTRAGPHRNGVRVPVKRVPCKNPVLP